MIPAQRQQAILKALASQEILSIAQLTSILDVSHMTIRRDIQQLENEQLVLQVSGGVRLAEHLTSEPSRKVKVSLQGLEKANIARLAVQHVLPNTTVYLDAGTTCLAIARELAFRQDLTVLSNDFAIIAYLMEHSQCKLYHTGGKVLRQNESCVGESAARFISSVNIHTSFISASSWDLTSISTPTEEKVPVKRAVIEASMQTILVCDASKFGKMGFFKAVPLQELKAIITDKSLAINTRKALEEKGITVYIAE